MSDIVLKNKHYTLTIGEDCIAKSLLYTKDGKGGIECLKLDEPTPMFSITEDRPYNNEIKLAYPNRETTFQANRVRMEGSCLIVGFELVGFEAIVETKITDNYISFKFIDFIVKPEHFGNLCMTPPPVSKFRMIQLPVKNRERFGEWLNVMWDDDVAVNVLETCSEACVKAEERRGYRIMSAEAVRGIKLRGCEAALIVASPDKLLDCVEAVEEDYDLPRGVASRRHEYINCSSFCVFDLNPKTVDDYVKYAKAAGISLYHVFYISMLNTYDLEYNKDYPKGDEDMRLVLDKLHAAGIKAGLHVLQTYTELNSGFVCPTVDRRLNLSRYFTLAKPIDADDDVIYVEEKPVDAEMHEKRRVLRFGGELIHYESYTTEYPYCFKGCERGFRKSTVTPHKKGLIGGILDISEYGATSVYINQNSNLQEENGKKLARCYNLGFDYIYFDGSEGVSPPNSHISLAKLIFINKLVRRKGDRKPSAAR